MRKGDWTRTPDGIRQRAAEARQRAAELVERAASLKREAGVLVELAEKLEAIDAESLPAPQH